MLPRPDEQAAPADTARAARKQKGAKAS